jgi:hypothetical protein
MNVVLAKLEINGRQGMSAAVVHELSPSAGRVAHDPPKQNRKHPLSKPNFRGINVIITLDPEHTE